MATVPTESVRPSPSKAGVANTWEVGSLVATARRQLLDLEQELAELDRVEREVRELRASLKPWEPAEHKQPLWELEGAIPEKQQEVALRVENIRSLLGQALELDPEAAVARGKLADLYWILFSRAEERGDEERMQRYLPLLALHDDGRYADLAEGTGTLQVETDPAGARVLLRKLHERGDEPGVDLGCSPVDPIDVAPGCYLLEIKLKGHAPTWRPIQIHRGADVRLQVRMFKTREIGADFCYVPAGRFVMGGDDDAPGCGPARSTFVDNVAIARYPVTVGEYMVFLDDLSSQDPGLALSFTPLPSPGDVRSNDPRLPVTGISYKAARTYCRWLSARTGIPHRLPTEVEWEKAARGADRRAFPWGDRFDPTFCHMRRSRPGPPRKVPVGSVRSDVSVFGVRDMAGGVSEWTRSRFGGKNDRLKVVRGGAFDSGSEACRCAARHATTREAQVGIGFRLVRPLSRGGGDQVRPAPIPSLLDDDWSHPVQPVEVLPVKESLDRVLDMARRLAASSPGDDLIGPLLSETVQLVQAERGLLLRNAAAGVTILEARTARGEPIPPSDQGYDGELVRAALRQKRCITLADSHPVIAVPLPDGESCLLLERRFHRERRFGGDTELVALAAADPLALALRLSR